MSYCDGTGNTTSCDSELFRVSDSGLLLNTPIQSVRRLNLLVGNNGSSVRLTTPTYYGILSGTDTISECIDVNSDVVAIPSQGAYYIDQYDPSGNGNINNFYTLKQFFSAISIESIIINNRRRFCVKHHINYLRNSVLDETGDSHHHCVSSMPKSSA